MDQRLTDRPFVGLDMVDGCKPSPRRVDLAFLARSLDCTFGTWEFDPSGGGLLPDQLAPPGFVLAIDGPQGLARSPGQSMRECERVGGVAGKSPYEFPPLNKPYGGFVRSSVMLFAALWQSGKFHLHGTAAAPGDQASLIEVYPGRAWRRLADLSELDPKLLRNKRLREGRGQRLRLLERNGVGLPVDTLPTHDQLDAALAAFIAYRIVQVRTTQQGAPPVWDAAKRVLREGFIVYP